ncbi:hypothetical protein [Rhodopila sp.]|uniref:hypothetical protein n=1 Tax=Rhodopila sp. TaxID=2480087 RepID=UPI003D124DED
MRTEDDQQDPSGSPSDPQPASPLRALVGLGLIVVLILGVLFVMQQLRHASAIQDCVASGRSNCAPIGSGR